MYEILKDFAGPVATVIVAAFVGWITWSHNTTQTALARYNLRINLFERKYAIYVAARETLSYLCSTRPDDIDWNRVTAWSFKNSGGFVLFREGSVGILGPRAGNV
jgi:hypothetical protein